MTESPAQPPDCRPGTPEFWAMIDRIRQEKLPLPSFNNDFMSEADLEGGSE